MGEVKKGLFEKEEAFPDMLSSEGLTEAERKRKPSDRWFIKCRVLK
jgi:hypothetical protein